MPSTATKRAIIAALFTLTSAVASATDKPPRYLNEPVLGLRLDAARASALPYRRWRSSPIEGCRISPASRSS